MLRLPSFSAGGKTWRLPLCNDSAAQLAEALLCDDRQQRQDRLEAALRGDPSLTLWTVCVAAMRGESSLKTFGQLACWLSDRALQVLQWPVQQRSQILQESPFTVANWANLAAHGVAAAEAARQSPTGVAADESSLLGLLRSAEQWLESGCDSGACESGDTASLCLPAWLVDRLSQSANGAHTSFDQNEQAHRRWADSDPSSMVFPLLPLLSASLARLADLEAKFDETLRREKLTAMKELAYGASHEINNPLANISTRAQTLLRDETDPQRRRKLATINAQAFRAHEMISNMMLFARPPAIHSEPVDLNAIVAGVIDELAPSARQQNTPIQRVGNEEPLVISIDGQQIAIALAALLDNSLEATSYGGRIEVSVRRRAVDGVECAEIVVDDNGRGIEIEQQIHLFDPFYSGREAGRGLGFGLSKCWRIVTLHGGSVDVHGRPQQGATFTIRLPAESDPSNLPQRRAS